MSVPPDDPNAGAYLPEGEQPPQYPPPPAGYPPPQAGYPPPVGYPPPSGYGAPRHPTGSTGYGSGMPPAPPGVPAASWGAPPNLQGQPAPGLAVLQAIGILIAGVAVTALIAAYTDFYTSFIGVLVGGGLGALVQKHARAQAKVLAPIAAVLTFTAVVIGFAVGNLEHIARINHVSYHRVVSQLGYSYPLRHGTNGFFWILALIGAFVAFRTSAGLGYRGIGRRRL